jgi:hypothetical protein
MTGDLQRVDREALEIAQARIAGIEIVNRQLDAHRLEPAQGDDGFFDALQDHCMTRLSVSFSSRQTESSPVSSRMVATFSTRSGCLNCRAGRLTATPMGGG